MERANANVAERFLRGIREASKHAVLLSGAGAETLAKQAANSLLCDAGNVQACGQCKGCTMQAAGSHPDFYAVDDVTDGADEKVIKVAAIREILEWTTRMAQYGGYKVILISRAHRMNEAAQNALLRTLEEPPEKMIFLLTGEESALLPTVRSRLSLLRLGEEEIGDEAWEEPARNLLQVAFRGKVIDLPALYAQQKGDLATLLSQQAVILRDAIAMQYELRLFLESRRDWLKEQPQLSVTILQKWMEALLDALSRLDRNANALLVIDQLCIEMERRRKGASK